MTKITKAEITDIINNVLSEQNENKTVELSLAQNPETGEIYVVKNADSDNPEIVGLGVKM